MIKNDEERTCSIEIEMSARVEMEMFSFQDGFRVT